MVTVNKESSGPRWRVAAGLQLEVAIVVSTAPEASVGKFDTVVGAHREELHRVWGDAKPLWAFQVVDLGEVVLFGSECLHGDVPHVLVVWHRSLPVHIATLALLQCEQLVQPVAQLILRLKDDGNAIVQGVDCDDDLATRIPE